MRHLPAIIAGAFIVGMLIWIYLFAPCEVFFFNPNNRVAERCRAELGR